ncbi:hypothetical protein QE152_g4839 [Popillia japonica]|uniref:Ribosomal protein L31 n=1 Tax=Popillia japonica TaxID=7064 RepID=A0AAW1MW79_POPJA
MILPARNILCLKFEEGRKRSHIARSSQKPDPHTTIELVAVGWRFMHSRVSVEVYVYTPKKMGKWNGKDLGQFIIRNNLLIRNPARRRVTRFKSDEA